MEITRRSFPVAVYTATHEIKGIHQPIGNLLTSINNEGICFDLTDVTFTPLSPSAALRAISIPHAVANKDDILFIAFEEEGVQDELTMLKRVERMIVYTQSFALRGEFHLGAEDQFRDLLNTLRGQFQPFTHATVFPLIECRVSVPRAHGLVLINKVNVQLYHPESAE